MTYLKMLEDTLSKQPQSVDYNFLLNMVYEYYKYHEIHMCVNPHSEENSIYSIIDGFGSFCKMAPNQKMIKYDKVHSNKFMKKYKG